MAPTTVIVDKDGQFTNPYYKPETTHVVQDDS